MPQRILVVDDERTIRDLVRDVLADEGYDVVGVSNGVEALALIEDDASFDLIILDMWMPVMNGWQFAQALDERSVSLPIIVMTADREARDRAEDIEAVGYIGKPFDVDQFIEAVREALSKQTTDRDVRLPDEQSDEQPGHVTRLLDGAADYMTGAANRARATFSTSARRPDLTTH